MGGGGSSKKERRKSFFTNAANKGKGKQSKGKGKNGNGNGGGKKGGGRQDVEALTLGLRPHTDALPDLGALTWDSVQNYARSFYVAACEELAALREKVFSRSTLLAPAPTAPFGGGKGKRGRSSTSSFAAKLYLDDHPSSVVRKLSMSELHSSDELDLQPSESEHSSEPPLFQVEAPTPADRSVKKLHSFVIELDVTAPDWDRKMLGFEVKPAQVVGSDCFICLCVNVGGKPFSLRCFITSSNVYDLSSVQHGHDAAGKRGGKGKNKKGGGGDGDAEKAASTSAKPLTLRVRAPVDRDLGEHLQGMMTSAKERKPGAEDVAVTAHMLSRMFCQGVVDDGDRAELRTLPNSSATSHLRVINACRRFRVSNASSAAALTLSLTRDLCIHNHGGLRANNEDGDGLLGLEPINAEGEDNDDQEDVESLQLDTAGRASLSGGHAHGAAGIHGNDESVDLRDLSLRLKLNESQQQAIKTVLGSAGVTTIQGPPGTGKTRTIAALAQALLSAPAGSSFPDVVERSEQMKQQPQPQSNAMKKKSERSKGKGRKESRDEKEEMSEDSSPSSCASSSASDDDEARVHATTVRRVLFTAASNKAVFNMMEKVLADRAAMASPTSASCSGAIVLQGVEDAVPDHLRPYFLHTRFRDTFEDAKVSLNTLTRLAMDAPESMLHTVIKKFGQRSDEVVGITSGTVGGVVARPPLLDLTDEEFEKLLPQLWDENEWRRELKENLWTKFEKWRTREDAKRAAKDDAGVDPDYLDLFDDPSSRGRGEGARSAAKSATLLQFLTEQDGKKSPEEKIGGPPAHIELRRLKDRLEREILSGATFIFSTLSCCARGALCEALDFSENANTGRSAPPGAILLLARKALAEKQKLEESRPHVERRLKRVELELESLQKQRERDIEDEAGVLVMYDRVYEEARQQLEEQLTMKIKSDSDRKKANAEKRNSDAQLFLLPRIDLEEQPPPANAPPLKKFKSAASSSSVAGAEPKKACAPGHRKSTGPDDSKIRARAALLLPARLLAAKIEKIPAFAKYVNEYKDALATLKPRKKHKAILDKEEPVFSNSQSLTQISKWARDLVFMLSTREKCWKTEEVEGGRSVNLAQSATSGSFPTSAASRSALLINRDHVSNADLFLLIASSEFVTEMLDALDCACATDPTFRALMQIARHRALVEWLKQEKKRVARAVTQKMLEEACNLEDPAPHDEDDDDDPRLRIEVEQELSIIVDEAAQATEADTFLALQHQPKRLILVGDPKQLSATVINSRELEKRGFARSMQERLQLINEQCREHAMQAALVDRQQANGEHEGSCGGGARTPAAPTTLEDEQGGNALTPADVLDCETAGDHAGAHAPIWGALTPAAEEVAASSGASFPRGGGDRGAARTPGCTPSGDDQDVAAEGADHLITEKIDDAAVAGPRVRFLDTQYRMLHPQISEYPRAAFYDHRLSDGTKDVARAVGAFGRFLAAVEERHEKMSRKLLSANALELVHAMRRQGMRYIVVAHDGLETEKLGGGTSTSSENPLEADLVAETYSRLMETGGHQQTPPDVVPLTFYQGQKALLTRELERRRCYSRNVVQTVDSFQGSEAEVVLISFVRSTSRRTFLDQATRLNVAFTRAKEFLIVFANVKELTGGGFDRSLQSSLAPAAPRPESGDLVVEGLGQVRALLKDAHDRSLIVESTVWRELLGAAAATAGTSAAGAATIASTRRGSTPAFAPPDPPHGPPRPMGGYHGGRYVGTAYTPVLVPKSSSHGHAAVNWNQAANHGPPRPASSWQQVNLMPAPTFHPHAAPSMARAQPYNLYHSHFSAVGKGARSAAPLGKSNSMIPNIPGAGSFGAGQHSSSHLGVSTACSYGAAPNATLVGLGKGYGPAPSSASNSSYGTLPAQYDPAQATSTNYSLHQSVSKSSGGPPPYHVGGVAPKHQSAATSRSDSFLRFPSRGPPRDAGGAPMSSFTSGPRVALQPAGEPFAPPQCGTAASSSSTMMNALQSRTRSRRSDSRRRRDHHDTRRNDSRRRERRYNSRSRSRGRWGGGRRR